MRKLNKAIKVLVGKSKNKSITLSYLYDRKTGRNNQKIKFKFPNIIKYVFGKGLIAAILFKSIKKPDQVNLIASKITEHCMRRGLLVVHTGRESIKIGPPLTISDQALLEGIQVLKDSIKYFYENEY